VASGGELLPELLHDVVLAPPRMSVMAARLCAMAEKDEIPELTDTEKVRWEAAKRAISGMAKALAAGTIDDEGLLATHSQIRSIDLDMSRVIDSLHVPEDAGEHARALERILRRIPPRWGRWISCDRGWYPLIVRIDEQLSGLDPDYAVHQIKEKYGGLRYYFQPSGGVTKSVRDAMGAVVRAAETESDRTCERCGCSGHPRVRQGWHKTLCDDCASALGFETARAGGEEG
jgi:hypothetical protein